MHMKKASAAWMRLSAVGVAVVASLPVAAGAASAADTVYTMADVQKHATAADCWSAINGSVYDLTKWESMHPGGSRAIVGLCGRDGSQAFNGRHAGSSSAATALADYKIGVLDAASVQPPSTTVPAGSYTMRDVHQHRRITDCWSAVSGNVYDLTTWLQSQNIRRGGTRQLCGHESTRQFTRITGQTDPAKVSEAIVLKGPLAAVSGNGGHGLGRPARDDGDDDGDGHHGDRLYQSDDDEDDDEDDADEQEDD